MEKRIQTQNEASYLNLPMNQEEYESFWTELVNAEVVTLHEFEKKELFEGCMPIEIMAKRGKDTLRFGPLKPVGFTDPRTGKRPYALVQLRQDNSEGNLFNMVGFQTNLKFGQQQRVFSKIPGLENASFAKYGVMHRNTYINSTKLLEPTYRFKKNPEYLFCRANYRSRRICRIYFFSDVVAALNAAEQYKIIQKLQTSGELKIDENTKEKEIKKQLENLITFPETTMIGALAHYISSPNENFQPMNANFGILPQLPEKIKDKKVKYTKLADKALEDLRQMLQAYDK